MRWPTVMSFAADLVRIIVDAAAAAADLMGAGILAHGRIRLIAGVLVGAQIGHRLQGRRHLIQGAWRPVVGTSILLLLVMTLIGLALSWWCRIVVAAAIQIVRVVSRSAHHWQLVDWFNFVLIGAVQGIDGIPAAAELAVMLTICSGYPMVPAVAAHVVASSLACYWRATC